MAEKYLERGRPVYNCFVDYTKAFDSVWHEGLWASFESYKVLNKLVLLLRNMYKNYYQLAVKVNQSLGEWFSAEIGSRQGDPISPMSFITLLERVMEKVECHTADVGINSHGMLVKDLRFADDVDLLAEDETEANQNNQ